MFKRKHQKVAMVLLFGPAQAASRTRVHLLHFRYSRKGVDSTTLWSLVAVTPHTKILVSSLSFRCTILLSTCWYMIPNPDEVCWTSGSAPPTASKCLAVSSSELVPEELEEEELLPEEDELSESLWFCLLSAQSGLVGS